MNLTPLDYFRLIFDVALIDYFGWVFFLWAGFYIWYKLHINSNQGKYLSTIKYIFLEVRIDELNERSPFAMEQIIAAMHATNQGFTWGEKFNGKVVLTSTFEIVSLGGKVSYIVKIAERYRNLFESAVFAQYPKAEIHQVEDYLRNIPNYYDPDKAEFNFWGTQLNKRKDGTESCYPIRTYPGFEHTEQETIIDPLASVLEALSNLQPYELMAYQIVFKPLDEDWKKPAKKILDKLKGKPSKPAEPSLLEKIIFGIPNLIISPIANILMPPPEKKDKKDQPPSLIQHLSEGEKGVISAIEHQLSKISYEVKIRLLYLAPKDKFNKGLHVPEIIGAFRNFDDPSLNGLKPDVKRTWTDATYKISQTLEQPFLDHRVIYKKRNFLGAFKGRDHWRGSGKTFMNTEEFATLYHFPQSPNARVSQVERVQTVKSAPPVDLPVSD